MRFFNKLGNVAFSQLFTYLLQQPIKDTLCGTKVLWRRDYERIAAARVVLRRLRSVRRLRPDLRGGPAEPEDRRDSGPLPRPHLRRDQHPALEARLAAAADVGDRRPQDQVRVTSAGRPTSMRDAAADRGAAGADAGAVRAAPARLGAEPRRCARSYADWYGRVARRAAAAGAAGRGSSWDRGRASRATFIPDMRADRPGAARPGTIARSAPRRCRSTTAASARWCCSTCSTTCRRRAKFFAEATRVLAPGGRIVMCEPYISPVSYPVYKFFHEEPLDLRRRSAGARRPAAGGARSVRREPGDPDAAVRARAARRSRQAFPALAIKRVQHMSGFSCPASGGFSHGPFLPWALWSLLHRLDARLPAALMRWMAFRMLVVHRAGVELHCGRVHRSLRGRVRVEARRATRVAGRADGGAAVPRSAVADLPDRRHRERPHRAGNPNPFLTAGSARLPLVAQPGHLAGVVGGRSRPRSGRRRATGAARVVLAVGVFSHWVLDFVTHRPDMPLYPGSPTSVGLGLWNFRPATMAVEIALFVVGVAIYARTTRAINWRGVVALWSLVVLLALFYAMTLLRAAAVERGLHQVRRPDRLAVRAVGLVDRPEPRARAAPAPRRTAAERLRRLRPGRALVERGGHGRGGREGARARRASARPASAA